MKYIVKVKTDGTFDIHTKVKGFFKEKIKKISMKDFFSLGKQSLHRNQYEMIPDIEGLTPSTYLFHKALFNLENKESDFGIRTIWNITDEEIVVKEHNINGHIFYENILTGKLNVSDENGNLIMFSNNYHYNHFGLNKINKRLVEILNQNACNGVLQTARETFELVDLMELNLKGHNAKLRCEECGETFSSIPEFFSHLIENKHYDSILDSNVFDPEVIRIKNLVEKEA